MFITLCFRFMITLSKTNRKEFHLFNTLDYLKNKQLVKSELCLFHRLFFSFNLDFQCYASILLIYIFPENYQFQSDFKMSLEPRTLYTLNIVNTCVLVLLCHFSFSVPCSFVFPYISTKIAEIFFL